MRFSLRKLLAVMLLSGVAIAEIWWSFESRGQPLDGLGLMRTIVVVMIGYSAILLVSQRPRSTDL